MATGRKGNRSNRTPISFPDSDKETDSDAKSEESPEQAGADNAQELMSDMSADLEATQPAQEGFAADDSQIQPSPQADGSSGEGAATSGGPEFAELVATRAELKRLESEVKDLRESLARRQADFENYRKRMERERSETYNRVVAGIPGKNFPGLHNFKKALG